MNEISFVGVYGVFATLAVLQLKMTRSDESVEFALSMMMPP
jgi:hypothetical protein